MSWAAVRDGAYGLEPRHHPHVPKGSFLLPNNPYESMDQQESSITAVLTVKQYVNNWAIRQCSCYYLCTNSLQLQFRSLQKHWLLRAGFVSKLNNQTSVFFSQCYTPILTYTKQQTKLLFSKHKLSEYTSRSKIRVHIADSSETSEYSYISTRLH
jgi:hypothetical protein